MGSATAIDLSLTKVDKTTKSGRCGRQSSMRSGGKKKSSKTSRISGSKRTSEAASLETVVPRKTPSRAAAIASLQNLKEKSIRLPEKPDLIVAKTDRVVEDEVAALRLTVDGPEDDSGLPQRGLFDFIIHDEDGVAQPLEMLEVQDLFVSGLVLPQGKGSADRSLGVMCAGFGRIEMWSISGFETGSPTVWVGTEVAEYSCLKPAGVYKRHFDLFFDKALLCVEVFKKLSKSFGGDPSVGLEELIAGAIRSLTVNKSFSGGNPTKEFIVSQGEFVFNQLAGLDEDESMIMATIQNGRFSEMPALIALRDECRQLGFSSFRPPGSIKITENSTGGSVHEEMDESEKMARLLHEEELWKAMKHKNVKSRGRSRKNQYYIKINESEIAADYPLPAFYKASADETDEYLFFEDDVYMFTPDMLPRRTLHDWALYNSDSRLVPLEVLPMQQGTESDVLVFGSGYMLDDDGNGFCDYEGSGTGGSDAGGVKGIPVYLSAIKEWMIEFGGSMLFVSIRTDGAWYRLGKPSKQYAPWFQPVVKIARVAISIIKMLKNESRVSRLSFSDVVKKVADLDKSDSAFVLSSPQAVERYVVVHGQVILQQFAEFPDDAIRKSAFINGLLTKMEQMRHTKLAMKKVTLKREANQNPVAGLKLDSVRRKTMQATTTKLINRIWGEYYSNYMPEEDAQTGAAVDEAKPGEEEEIEENDDDEDEEEIADLAPKACVKPSPSLKSSRTKSRATEAEWKGVSVGKLKSGESLYREAIVRGIAIAAGGALLGGIDDRLLILFIEYMFEKANGLKMIHGRLLQRGSETVLGNAANARELFLTNECVDIELEDVKETVVVELRRRPWGHEHRRENADADRLDRLRAEEREKKGLPTEYYCRSLYAPDRGAFFRVPYDTMGLGNGSCYACSFREACVEGFSILAGKSGFLHKGVRYSVNDFLYVNPQEFSAEAELDQEKFKAGRNVGLRAYVVCQFLGIEVCSGSKHADAKSTKIKVRRFFRPEDVGQEKAYVADIREVYYSNETRTIPAESVEGKCEVRKQRSLPDTHAPAIFDHVFFCHCIYDRANGSLKQLPASVRFESSKAKAKDKGKGIQGEEERQASGKDVEGDIETSERLATLDIFAGCGGLSEGLQQSGVSVTKWAIEYDAAAAEAFKLNHREAQVFNKNCNGILRAIMERCGDKDDCISTPDAADLAAKLSEEQKENLPLPGQVDFINGGPPCQGFSGMNRFNQSTWSKVQCEMILAFLSFADYFRPRFFLLENVRNFVSFNKGQTFRLTLASLLEMGYQVRFGILEAGTYGVAQSRKRAFIWAASPKETLPEWPEPMHVFSSAQLKITLTESSCYAAVKSTAGGAPLRSITVKDTIGDLPPVSNGASDQKIMYGNPPVSWFQKQVRSEMTTLVDHIAKEMNELNLIRCQRIPKRPGADWHDLPDEKVKLSSGQLADLVPWCLPNTAKRHNQWKGLYGRLDWEGNFPTSVTDPQPMGKVGMCFHPEQDRILTVRECARSQGFLDKYVFWGTVQNKHRQIGNAVPPPLAYALGRKLKEVVDSRH
ncbi:DNA cytosine-5-methyltransferase 1B [Nymphaea thermarum]|nr:DNA cytosine-5-methyltransferase 1B [Nymphaea thermarum]